MIEPFLAAQLSTAFVLGLLGAGHCLGMCGGIITSLSMASGKDKTEWSFVGLYQVGRLSSYSAFGLLAGLLGSQLESLTSFPLLKLISAALLILMGLYLSRLWMAIGLLEKLGSRLWARISPIASQLLPVRSRKQALLLGALWGWLPCGLVYTSLGYAIATANALTSALFMLFFGLGTLPATLAAGAGSNALKTWLNKPFIRYFIAVILISFGGLLLLQILSTELITQHH